MVGWGGLWERYGGLTNSSVWYTGCLAISKSGSSIQGTSMLCHPYQIAAIYKYIVAQSCGWPCNSSRSSTKSALLWLTATGEPYGKSLFYFRLTLSIIPLMLPHTLATQWPLKRALESRGTTSYVGVLAHGGNSRYYKQSSSQWFETWLYSCVVTVMK